MAGYVIGIDQSTQGTKGLLFDEKAKLIYRMDISHKQKISKEGYISHDMEEVYGNLVKVVQEVVEKSGIEKREVLGIGISNQRETTVGWNRETGNSVCDAIVWQCARAEEICKNISDKDKEFIRKQTGIPVSPYFPAGKMSWILQNIEGAKGLAKESKLCLGTVDSYLLFRLTKGKSFYTEYSNASRTQLFDLHSLTWNENVCNMFGIPIQCLPVVRDSNSMFGETDLEGYFDTPIPIHSMLGDSHGALFGQGCLKKGMVKATYGTGSSLMMNIGEEYVESKNGLVTSLAWGIDGKVMYVLEGNLNYTGAVITWLKDDLKVIESAKETDKLAQLANQEDNTYLVPAFSGLGAPYWNSNAKAVMYGMSRITGKNEIVKAALEGIVYQITDVLRAMEQDTEIVIESLSVDGGPTGNTYLMQFQSDMADGVVKVPDVEELSGMGAAWLAGMALGVYKEEIVFQNLSYQEYAPRMKKEVREQKYRGWKETVGKV